MAELPIVDAHQHFWDLERNYLPWLCDEPPIPFRYGDYRALRRNYLPGDYLRDAAGHRVVKTVYVETEWDPGDLVGETRWLQEIIAETGFPHAIVAGARSRNMFGPMFSWSTPGVYSPIGSAWRSSRMSSS